MAKRFANNSNPTELKPGDIETEMGIPIPGPILEMDQWVQTAIKKLPEIGPLEMDHIFQRTAPLAIDIGCGNGRFAISSAVRRPDWDHIAIDILPAVIRYGTRRGNQRGLSNLRFAVCDAWRFLQIYLAPESVDEFHIYHPQPYANPLDANKRMLNPAFVVWMHDRLKPGGLVYLQSDRAEYWKYIRSTVGSILDWTEVSEKWNEDPYGRSRREVISGEAGLPIFRGVATKRVGLNTDQAKDIATGLDEPVFAIERSNQKKKRTTRSRRRPKR